MNIHLAAWGHCRYSGCRYVPSRKEFYYFFMISRPCQKCLGMLVGVDSRERTASRMFPLQQHHCSLPKDERRLHPCWQPLEVHHDVAVQDDGRKLWRDRERLLAELDDRRWNSWWRHVPWRRKLVQHFYLPERQVRQIEFLWLTYKLIFWWHSCALEVLQISLPLLLWKCVCDT